MNSDELLQTIPDDTLKNIVQQAADKCGISLGEENLARIVEVVKNVLADCIDQAQQQAAAASAQSAVQTLVQRETLRFMRAIGAGPNHQFCSKESGWQE